jgi:hypothetical protein
MVDVGLLASAEVSRDRRIDLCKLGRRMDAAQQKKR